jgi:hypothetical protein
MLIIQIDGLIAQEQIKRTQGLRPFLSITEIDEFYFWKLLIVESQLFPYLPVNKLFFI